MGGECHRAGRLASGKHSIGLWGRAPIWSCWCPQGIYSLVGEIRRDSVYTPTAHKIRHGPLGKLGLLCFRKKYHDFLFPWRSSRADVGLSSLQCPWGLAQGDAHVGPQYLIWQESSYIRKHVQLPGTDSIGFVNLQTKSKMIVVFFFFYNSWGQFIECLSSDWDS